MVGRAQDCSVQAGVVRRGGRASPKGWTEAAQAAVSITQPIKAVCGKRRRSIRVFPDCTFKVGDDGAARHSLVGPGLGLAVGQEVGRGGQGACVHLVLGVESGRDRAIEGGLPRAA